MGTLIVLLILIAIVSGAVYSMYRDRKKGKSACGCSCGSCTGCGKSCSLHADAGNNRE